MSKLTPRAEATGSRVSPEELRAAALVFARPTVFAQAFAAACRAQ